jgi:integrase
VRPGAVPVYVVAKRRPGEAKPVRVTLGRVGEISLAKARDEARAAIAALRQGVDVNTEKRNVRDARAGEHRRADLVRVETGFGPGTFGEIAARYIERECPRLARGQEVESIIRRELLPPLGTRPVAELRRRDLGDVVNAITRGGHPAAAHKVREIGKRFDSWADDEELIEGNPFRGGRSPLRRQERSRALSEEEIAALWRAWREMGPPLGSFMMFALATGQRRGETAAMERAELDLAQRLWSIPAEKAKNGRAHLVPLSALAIEILEGVPSVDDKFVFATRAGSHISGFSKAKARAGQLSGVADWRLHDLRRTAATRLAELGVAHPVVSKLLNHSPRGVMGVTAIYNRHEYLAERRDAMERWARRIGEIVASFPLRGFASFSFVRLISRSTNRQAMSETVVRQPAAGERRRLQTCGGPRTRRRFVTEPLAGRYGPLRRIGICSPTRPAPHRPSAALHPLCGGGHAEAPPS